MSFKIHYQPLLKVLNELYVIPDTNLDKFENLVNQIWANNHITFTNEDINQASIGHTKALHISLKCKGVTIAKVLVDNGSTLNVLPIVSLE